MQNIRRFSHTKNNPAIDGNNPPAKLLKSQNSGSNLIAKLAVVTMFICEFVVLVWPSAKLITGPTLTLCSAYLMFTDFFYVPLTVIMVPLGTLGTIIAGKYAVYTLLFPLLIIRLLVVGFRFKIMPSDFVLFLIGALHLAQLILFDGYAQATPKTIYIAATLCWFIYIKCYSRDHHGVINNFVMSLAVCVTVNALASLISGRYTLYEGSDRMGLAGVTGGNPNHAGFYIGFTIAVILTNKRLKLWIKLPLLLILAIMIITTVSLSALIGVTVVVLSYFILTNRNKQKLTIFLSIVLVIVLALTIFPLLNIQSDSTVNSTNYLEYYQDKLLDRLNKLDDQNYDAATSRRTGLTKENLSYFADQSVIRQLFGGNSANPLNTLVSHNCFADILLRFGYVGLFAAIILVIYGFCKQFIYARKHDDFTLLLCKVALLFWSFTISMYEGMLSCMWIGFLLFL